MNADKLKKEAEEWLCNNLHSASEEDFIKAMIDIAEPREKQIQIDAEQILALQKQNGELTDELTKKADTNHQLVEQMAKLSEKNAELEEKLANADYQLEGRDLEIMEQKEQLTKAKEIIHKVCYEYGIYDKDLMEEAKQFLNSEVEK